MFWKIDPGPPKRREAQDRTAFLSAMHSQATGAWRSCAEPAELAGRLTEPCELLTALPVV